MRLTTLSEWKVFIESQIGIGKKKQGKLKLEIGAFGDMFEDTSACAVAVAEVLRTNVDLKELSLVVYSEDKLRIADVMALAAALQVNGTLLKFELMNVQVLDAGAEVLADALKLNSATALQKLILYGDGIGDAGAAALAEALKHNGILTKLDLSDNSIGDTGAAALANALKGNSSLVS